MINFATVAMICVTVITCTVLICFTVIDVITEKGRR